MSKLGAELQELAIEAVKLALDCFANGEQNPFILFHDQSGKTHLVDVKSADGDITPELVENAKGIIADSLSNDCLRHAIAYDDFLTTYECKSDAVFVEAGERGEPDAWLIAQPNRVQKRSKRATRLGSPRVIGAAQQLLG